MQNQKHLQIVRTIGCLFTFAAQDAYKALVLVCSGTREHIKTFVSGLAHRALLAMSKMTQRALG